MFFPFLLLLPCVAADAGLRLLHRVYDPSTPTALFFERGVLTPNAAGQFSIEPSPSLYADLQAFAQTAGDVSTALYQLALAPTPGEDAPWLISSARACHLTDRATEHIVLHVATPDSAPYALDYFLDPVPHDGACPPTPSALAAPGNISVSLSLATVPPLPDLRAPPPVSHEGETVQPLPEKNFLQKYWLYIVIALGALLLAPGGDDGAAGGR